MSRKKATSTAEPIRPPASERETISLTVEVDKKLYEQVKASAAACGYTSIEEWHLETIMDKV